MTTHSSALSLRLTWPERLEAAMAGVTESCTRLKRLSTASIESNTNLSVTVKVFSVDVNICSHLILSKGDWFSEIFGLCPIS